MRRFCPCCDAKITYLDVEEKLTRSGTVSLKDGEFDWEPCGNIYEHSKKLVYTCPYCAHELNPEGLEEIRDVE